MTKDWIAIWLGIAGLLIISFGTAYGTSMTPFCVGLPMMAVSAAIFGWKRQ